MSIYAHESKLNTQTGPPQPFPKQTDDLIPDMRCYLHNRELSYNVAANNGWYPSEDIDGIPRIVIPGTNNTGISYWQARAMVTADKRYTSARGGRQGSVVVVWPRRSAVRSPNEFTLVVVEGPMDALAVASSGHLGIATMGKQSISFAVDYIVENYSCLDIVVLIVPDLDSPEFGVEAVRLFNLKNIHATMKIPSSKDIADMSKTAREEFLK